VKSVLAQSTPQWVRSTRVSVVVERGGVRLDVALVERSLSTCGLSVEESGHATAATNDIVWQRQRQPVATTCGQA
jgi:hypothetical protein